MCKLCCVKVWFYRKVFRKNLGMGEWAPLTPSPIQCYPPHYFIGVWCCMRGRGAWVRARRGRGVAMC